jgi:hypothetical protein
MFFFAVHCAIFRRLPQAFEKCFKICAWFPFISALLQVFHKYASNGLQLF